MGVSLLGGSWKNPLQFAKQVASWCCHLYIRILLSEFGIRKARHAQICSQNASVPSLEPQDCKQGLDLNTQTTRQVTKQRTKMQIDMKTTHRKWMMHLGLTIDSPRFFFGAGRLTSLTASASAWHSSNSKVLKLRSLPLQLTTQWLKIQPVKLFKA